MKRFVLKKDEAKTAEYTLDYSSLLNTSQLEAVLHTSGPALVVAGAGTGKTRTLIYRVARLIESGVSPEQILLLTFTRRASREMLDRASNLLDKRCSRVKGGTFHYMCNQILHRFHEQIEFPSNFSILDASDAQEMIQALRSQKKYPKRGSRFPQKSTLQSIISAAINKTKSIEEIVADQYPQFESHLEAIRALAADYQHYKKLNHVMDFDDLLIYTKHLLEKDASVRYRLNQEYKYVMVDEYQDTNALQADLIDLLSREHRNVMAVGDDAQSIYAFRGASHKNILEFPERFPGAKLIKLEENFRSTPEILDLANQVMDKAIAKYDKTLYSIQPSGDLPGLVPAPDDRDQSRFITQMILELREQEYDLSEIAILFRNSRDSFELEIELNHKKIPFIKFGGQKFSDAAHIKDVLSHFKVIHNHLDVISWNRLLMLIEGIGPKTAQDFIEWLREVNNPYELHKSTVSNAYIDRIKTLVQLLDKLRSPSNSLKEKMQMVVDYYAPICKKRFDDHPKRLKDLEAFVGICSRFTTLDQLLSELVLDPIDATTVDYEATKNDESPLVLSTIHSAKGLEWRVVFLIQALDGILPSGYALNDDDQTDEELRLLYVACTRAKELLLITYPTVHESAQGDYFTKRSRFLENIPESVLEPWVIEYETPENKSINRGQEPPLLDA